jgi:hypothetical protein
MSRREALAWEGRWSLPVALATLAAVALLIASVLVVTSLGGGGEAESLRDVYAHSGTITLSSVLQGVAFVLLVAPLVYLFRAASARSNRMRVQFLPLVVAAPLALGVASVLNGVAANEAASDFVAGKSTTNLSAKEAAEDCRSERKDDAAGFRSDFGKGAPAVSDCTSTALADDEAENAISDASIRQVAEVLQLGGALALAFALVYCCLNALRTGLLTRFWGSLGMALGVAAVIGLFQLSLIWFIYFALLAAGWLPGARPPAWAAGEAIPWPSPGEKAAAELSPKADENGELPAGEQEDPVEKEQPKS